MKKTYLVHGMTCGGCVAFVRKKLIEIPGILKAEVQLNTSEAVIETEKPIDVKLIQATLGVKYSINEKKETFSTVQNPEEKLEKKSKLKQLKPLFLVFAYLFGASFLLNFKDRNTVNAMLDFMGLFYIVFSFFKLLDLKGFSESFKMYDPLTRLLPIYGWVYPFIELALGVSFLMRFQIPTLLVITMLILGITTIGVLKVLADKKSIRCACLGTALKLPMTQATLIENIIMIGMSILLLVSSINL